MGWRFAVSTLGMPGTPVVDAARTAVAHGCAGLELRVHPDEQVHLGLSGGAVDGIRSTLDGEGLAIACLAGYAKVAAPGADRPVVDELKALIALAHRIGAPSVRVFPGGNGDGDAQRRIGAVLGDLRDAGVRLLVETHDSHPTGTAALGLVAGFGAPDLAAVLWDAVHPWRAGEEPAATFAVLGPYLGYFQVKDAVSRPDPTPVPPGAGAVPLGACGELLRSWAGWVSLEWEKAWYPGIAPVDVPLRAAAAWFQRYAPV
ncbi:sugar phosphate isomerase/epimerase family protein [Amycolatopsis sp. A133]|uniref:sugar phosphate isomerase/epimerase family protein n=1 Tax=Amycolatopsis sp. A133 TaxID=3064472 RepID=UPI0027FDC1B7|nr:sugar phosphate isomerase/epimerase family protein [Amycolatopsis sp. A133]MDQ7803075.1 sugar phosphate isomerase/epimerase family protein [Amycolatopsis sp. A133]